MQVSAVSQIQGNHPVGFQVLLFTGGLIARREMTTHTHTHTGTVLCDAPDAPTHLCHPAAQLVDRQQIGALRAVWVVELKPLCRGFRVSGV